MNNDWNLSMVEVIDDIIFEVHQVKYGFWNYQKDITNDSLLKIEKSITIRDLLMNTKPQKKKRRRTHSRRIRRRRTRQSHLLKRAPYVII